jgi:spermidine/putrescine transport system ATP-binding protein
MMQRPSRFIPAGCRIERCEAIQKRGIALVGGARHCFLCPPMNAPAPLPMVELRGVSKRFGDCEAVRDVSLTVGRGEFVTLLGPSGCGKTTLLRMIAGFETPTEGRVLLDGKDVTALPANRRDVNQVFQSYALFPHLTVWQNIAFGLEMKRLPRGEIAERVRRAVELVALGGKENSHPDALSGGQRQRVAVARAVVCEPKVLLLDEPLSALDARLRLQMQTELKQLQRRLGITFILVTHDQGEALAMSDRIAVMNAGRIEQIGSAAAIYHQPRSRFVAEFVGQTNIFPGRVVERMADGVIVALAGDIRLRVEARQQPSTEGEVLVSFRPEDVRIAPETGPASAPDGASATMVERIFRGQSEQFTLRTAGGTEIIAVVPKSGAAAAAACAGETVRWSVNPGDVVLLESK